MSPSGEQEPVPYSFGRSAHLTSEKSSLYQEAAGEIARGAAAVLDDWLPGFTVDAEPIIEAEAGQELVEDIAEFDVVEIVGVFGECGSVVVELPLAITLVSGLLGGTSMPAGEPRPLTSIEVRVLDLLTSQLLEQTASTLLVTDTHINRSVDEGFAAAHDEDPEARIGFALRLHGLGGDGLMTFGFELSALQEFSDLVDRRLSGRRTAEPVRTNPEMAAALQPVPIPLTVGFGRVELTAREVVGLCAGDVIRTRQAVTDDLVASVGDTRLFAVRLGQRGTRLVAELLAPIEDDASTVGGTATPVPAARMADTTTLPIWAEGGRSTVAPGSSAAPQHYASAVKP